MLASPKASATAEKVKFLQRTERICHIVTAYDGPFELQPVKRLGRKYIAMPDMTTGGISVRDDPRRDRGDDPPFFLIR